MTRETLERKMQELLDEVLLLGSMVEQAALQAVRALKDRNLAASEEIYKADQQINEKRFEIEERTLVLIATQGPMASDLRTLAAVLDVTSELERMGDYAKGIARINMNLGPESRLKAPPELLEMAEISVDMLHRALEAFVTRNAESASLIPAEDDKVDALFTSINNDILRQMIAQPDNIGQINHLLWACHNLERMADRVTNICERTIFVVTGKMAEFDSSDDEQRLRSENL